MQQILKRETRLSHSHPLSRCCPAFSKSTSVALYTISYHGDPQLPRRPRITVARPMPTPLPLKIPCFGSIRLNIGAFFKMSGITTNRISPPLCILVCQRQI